MKSLRNGMKKAERRLREGGGPAGLTALTPEHWPYVLSRRLSSQVRSGSHASQSLHLACVQTDTSWGRDGGRITSSPQALEFSPYSVLLESASEKASEGDRKYE